MKEKQLAKYTSADLGWLKGVAIALVCIALILFMVGCNNLDGNRSERETGAKQMYAALPMIVAAVFAWILSGAEMEFVITDKRVSVNSNKLVKSIPVNEIVSVAATKDSVTVKCSNDMITARVDDPQQAYTIILQLLLDRQDDTTPVAPAQPKPAENQEAPKPTTPAKEEQPIAPLVPEKEAMPVKPVVAGERMTCPKCGTEQNVGRKICWNCGVHFVD